MLNIKQNEFAQTIGKVVAGGLVDSLRDNPKYKDLNFAWNMLYDMVVSFIKLRITVSEFGDDAKEMQEVAINSCKFEFEKFFKN